MDTASPDLATSHDLKSCHGYLLRQANCN